MRVVVDTNVLVSSFFGGNPRKIIDLWKTGDITLRLSRDIIDEYLDVLQRLEADPALISELLSLFAGGYHLLFAGSTPSLTMIALPGFVVVTDDTCAIHYVRQSVLELMP